jgi:hypothetical protein
MAVCDEFLVFDEVKHLLEDGVKRKSGSLDTQQNSFLDFDE